MCTGHISLYNERTNKNIFWIKKKKFFSHGRKCENITIKNTFMVQQLSFLHANFNVPSHFIRYPTSPGSFLGILGWKIDLKYKISRPPSQCLWATIVILCFIPNHQISAWPIYFIWYTIIRLHVPHNVLYYLFPSDSVYEKTPSAYCINAWWALSHNALISVYHLRRFQTCDSFAFLQFRI